MIPISDLNLRRRFPWLTLLIVAANLLVYIYQTRLPFSAHRQLIMQRAIVPYRLLHEPSLPVVMTLFTSMFLHGGWGHIIVNMLYLWVFGDNVEDAFGRLRYAVLYLAAGLIAAVAQVVAMPDSTVPIIGASGAVAGVLGAYLVLYPGAEVRTLVLTFFIRIIYLPALIVLGGWFILQLINALSASGGNVAWFAHIGGFVAGMLGGWMVKRKRSPQGWSDPLDPYLPY
ncbi:MAG: rhomboid family intramembrane serine protease [Anaerolineae bacterium]|jgi:membrane associated rhomboid family serine protease